MHQYRSRWHLHVERWTRQRADIQGADRREYLHWI
jgi:hypothetical protein